MKNKTLLMTIAIFTIAFSISAQEKGTFTDARDNKTYKTVKIGTQTWMAENLAFKAPSGCWAYNNDDGNVTQYGYLYDWKTAISSCPTGWHLPTKEEYKEMLTNVGEDYKALIEFGGSGFSALFGGYRNDIGGFDLKDLNAYFWSSKASYDYDALVLCVSSGDEKFFLYRDDQSLGFSVRCIKD